MGDYKLIYLPPEQLNNYWPWIRYGLAKVLERNKDTWLPEEIYHGIKVGSCHVLVAQCGKGLVGFMVVELHGNTVHLWACYNIGGTNVLYKLYPVAVEMFKSVGANRITMSSSRPGWAKLAKRFGLTPGNIEYSRNI